MKRISQAELDILDILWTEAPLAASDVAERVPVDKEWTSRTVKTLLSRLVEKGAVGTEQDGRRFLYSPLINKDSYSQKAARRLADRLFGGRAAPLVAQLADTKSLSDDDIAELEALIKALKS